MLPPLRVIIEDRPLRKALTGVGNYIAQLLRFLPVYAPRVVAEPFLHTHIRRRDWNQPPGPPDAGPRVNAGGMRVPWFVRSAMQFAYDIQFRRKTRGYDLYHEPNHVPIRSPLPTVTTIHDLSVLVHPAWHPADRVRWYEKSFSAGARQTRHFLAASEFTKREMIRVLGVSPENITVTYQAPRDAFRETGGTVQRGEKPMVSAEIFDGRTPSHGFFLYVGTLEPRKNVEGLLEAFAALPSDIRTRHPLLIAGAWGWKAEQIRARLADRKLSDDVRLLGYLHDPQLAALYANCTAFVWPTWYEGFGLPPLEALACGARVIVSNVASLPEVVGDAGELLDPNDLAAWTRAMRIAAERFDSGERGNAAGLVQAGRFTWKEFIERTVEGYTR